MLDTRGATNTLKGLAILVVMLNHFFLVNVTDTVGGIAYTFLAVFFWVSGWGVRISLERRGMTSLDVASLLRFWCDRLLRLLPLYYTAILVRDLVMGTVGSVFFYINIYAEGHFWFVPAIVNCYLLAPLLHVLLTRNWKAALAAGTMICLCGTGLLLGGVVPDQYSGLLDAMQLTYKKAFMLHAYIFMLGMFCAMFRERIVSAASSARHDAMFLCLFAVFPAGYWMVKNLLHGGLGKLAQLGMLGVALVLCLYGVRYRVTFRIVARVGVVSYGFYLFHMTFFNLLHRAGLPHGMAGVAIAVASLPVLYILVSMLERVAGKVAKALSPNR